AIAGSLADGLVALEGLMRYARFRRGDRCTPARVEPKPPPLLPQSRSVLTEYESKNLLRASGLPVTHEILARSPEEAVLAAEKIGFPVALKVQSKQLVHKSDVGALVLDLVDAKSVRVAFSQLQQNVRVLREDV